MPLFPTRIIFHYTEECDMAIRLFTLNYTRRPGQVKEVLRRHVDWKMEESRHGLRDIKSAKGMGGE